MLKKIYVEITNNCNLACPFCIKNTRPKKFMTVEEFTRVTEKLKNHTKYLYFHILGEPLLHPEFSKLVEIAHKNFFINITTNGYLIERLKNIKNIRQVNISLHSFNPQYNKSLEEYLNDIFSIIDEISRYTYISLRLWVKNAYTEEILKKINEHYQKNIDNLDFLNIKLANNIFLNTHDEFTWPSLDETVKETIGSCYALKDHIGILVDGTVVPCCLDSKGDINLGNIFVSSLEEIIESSRYQNMLLSFKNNIKCEELCQKCSFINKK